MAVTASTVTVGTSATQIATNPHEQFTSDETTVAVLLKHPGGATIYLGGQSVTTGTGFPWDATDGALSLDLEGGETLYGVLASGTASVRVLGAGR